jgi:formate dehydrogenase
MDLAVRPTPEHNAPAFVRKRGYTARGTLPQSNIAPGSLGELMPETHRTFCRICESVCGLEASVEERRIVGIRPNFQNIGTDGFACVKGLRQHELFDSPDRLRYPEKRVGKRWERISWDQALTEIGARVRSLVDAGGPDSIAMYVGTAAGFGVLHPIFAQGFMDGIGSNSMYSSATQDCANKFAVAHEIYGFAFTQPFPDLERTECLIIVGANPVVSKWSFLHVPNASRRLRRIQARGGRVWVVDPRRTETAKVASEHVFIRPNTDVFFYLSFLNELVSMGGVDRERVARHTTGFDAVEKLVQDWPSERTAAVTGIPPQRLREMVDGYRAARGAALYSSTGVNMGTNGSLCFWLQEVINAVSGNLDRRGGTLVGHGIVDFAKFGKRTGMFMKDVRSRVGDFRSVNDALPGGILADEILTPGERQVRALFVTGGNPLITMPNAGRLRRAFEELELLVTLDIYRNETGSLAHYTLPCTTPLERPDLLFAFPLLMGMQSRPYLQATEQVAEPAGEQRDEASIYLDLCRAAGVSLFGSRTAQRLLEWSGRLDRRRRRGRGGLPGVPQELLLSLLLRLSRAGSFRGLLAHPDGKRCPDHPGGDFLGERLVTEDGTVHLAPERLVRQAAKLETDFARQKRTAGRLKLISKRSHETHNSWTHNIDAFVSGSRRTNHLHMHPDDARRLGLGEGDLADVESKTATLRVPVKLLPDLMPGCVALPHGWGHQHATGLSVASCTTGVNVNLLTADGPEELERVSGMANLTGFAVDVRPAAGHLDPASWSGMAESGVSGAQP